MLRVRDLHKIYRTRGGDVEALKGVSFSLPEKGLVFIIGKSGSGKSTLMNLLGGLDDITSGEIEVGGQTLSTLSVKQLDAYRNRSVGMIYQNFNLFEDETVANNVRIATDISSCGADKIDALLERLEILDKKNVLAKHLSGGQKQRVAIARAIVKEPLFLLADEPTGNLDATTSKRIFELLKEISREHLVVLISHDEEAAKNYGDRILTLSDGKIVSDVVRDEAYVADPYLLPIAGKAVLPEETIAALNKAVSEGGLPYRLSNQGSEFVPYDSASESEEQSTPLPPSPPLKPKVFAHLLRSFSKKAVLPLVFSALLSVILIDVLAVGHSFVEFDERKAVAKISDDYGITEFPIVQTGRTEGSGRLRKDSFRFPSAEEESALREKFDCTITPVWRSCAFVGRAASEYFMNPFNFILSPTASYYCTTAAGGIVADEAYLKRHFGDYKVIAGSLDACMGNGAVIATDYFADSYLAAWPESRAKPGEEKYAHLVDGTLLGYRRFRIGAIIDTDYETRYADIINAYETPGSNISETTGSALYAQFSNDVQTRLGMVYSMDPEFPQRHMDASNRYAWIPNYAASREGSTAQLANPNGHVYVGVEDTLHGNECRIGRVDYARWFNIRLEEVDDKFEPFDLTLMGTDPEEPQGTAPSFSKKLHVVGLFSDGTNTVFAMEVAEETVKEINRTYCRVFAYLLDDPSLAYEVSQYGQAHDIFVASSVYTTLFSSLEVIRLIISLYGYIAVGLIIALAILIVVQVLGVVRGSAYRIGVFKALGYGNRPLAVTVVGLTFLMSAVVLGAVVVSSHFLAPQINGLVVSAFAKVNYGSLPLNLTYVSFSAAGTLIYSGIVLLLASVSAILPFLLIRSIKPNNIISRGE